MSGVNKRHKKLAKRKLGILEQFIKLTKHIQEMVKTYD